MDPDTAGLAHLCKFFFSISIVLIPNTTMCIELVLLHSCLSYIKYHGMAGSFGIVYIQYNH